jgi:hypothetical protein
LAEKAELSKQVWRNVAESNAGKGETRKEFLKEELEITYLVLGTYNQILSLKPESFIMTFLSWNDIKSLRK